MQESVAWLGLDAHAKFSLLAWMDDQGRRRAHWRFPTTEPQLIKHLQLIPAPIKHLALIEGRLTDEMRARLLLPHHALHAVAIRFSWRDSPFEFRCEPEKWFTDFAAGG